MSDARSNDEANQAKRVIDGLTDLFDGVAPTNAIEAEDELRHAGYDPHRLAAALASRAEEELATRSGSWRETRHRNENGASARRPLRVRRGSDGPAARDPNRTSPRRVRWYGVFSAAVGLSAISVIAWRFLETRYEAVPRPSALPPSRVQFPFEQRDGDARLDGRSEAPKEGTESVGSHARPGTAEGGMEAPGSIDGTATQSAVVQDGFAASDATTGGNAARLAPLPRLADGLAEGEIEILDKETWRIGAGRLPEEILARYRDGDWSHSIYQPRSDTRFWDPDFRTASEGNRGRFELGPSGEIIVRTTGKPPASLYGVPFPEIDSSDPRAGAKVVWNYFYHWYNEGNGRESLARVEVDASGVHRDARSTGQWRFYDGQPAALRPRANADNLVSESLELLHEPPDMKGNSLLTLRFRDPHRHDDTWLYLPTLRRVRRLSSAQRSDTLFSVLTADDGPFFDGKPETFNWRLVGEGEVLAFFDQVSLIEGTARLRCLPDGGFEATDSGKARVAFQVPRDWAGSSKAWDQPLESEFVLVPRPVWIIEGLNPSAQYARGKIVLRIDKQSWQGSYSTIYDRTGQLWESILRVQDTFFEVNGVWRPYTASSLLTRVDWQLGRGVVVFPDPERPSSQTRIEHPADLFTIAKMVELSH